jgi:hypothetical protein
MNTTNPDSPAMPQPYTGLLHQMQTGLTAREHAGILLLQPTGTPWLDEMIEARRRDELAGRFFAGWLANPTYNDSKDTQIAEYSIDAAEVLLAELKNAANHPTDNGEGKQ